MITFSWPAFVWAWASRDHAGLLDRALAEPGEADALLGQALGALNPEHPRRKPTCWLPAPAAESLVLPRWPLSAGSPGGQLEFEHL